MRMTSCLLSYVSGWDALGRLLPQTNAELVMDSLTPQDVGLIESLKDGGEVAQVQFFDSQRENLKRLARFRVDRRLARRIDESDIIQDAFIEYRKRVPKYVESPEIPPEIWLRGLVRQVVLRKNRDNIEAQCRDVRRERNAQASAVVNIDQLSASMSTVSADLQRAELHRKLVSILEDMSALEKEILTLVHFEDRTVREASIELEISLEAAKKRYRRALSRLREVYKPELLSFV